MGDPVFKKSKKYESDIWAVGVVRAPVQDFMGDDTPDDVVWLESKKPYSFLADPFGIWRDGKLYIFVEALDYRDKKGVIDCFVLDGELNVLEHLSDIIPHESHLSYPYVVEDQGEIYMIPEASRSGACDIYRAVDFPAKWEALQPILPDVPMIDASFVKYNDLWWVFYALPGDADRAFRELHIAHASHFLGPWTPHAHNPVSVDATLSRPGGRPFVHEGQLHLPVQNCRPHYGASINIMRIDDLTPQSFAATKVRGIDPVFHPEYPDGLHTLCECGSVTLIDCKKIKKSRWRYVIDVQRRLGRIFPFVRAW